MCAKSLGRPSGLKKVSNVDKDRARRKAREERGQERSDLIKAEAKARGRGLTRLEVERLVAGRAPSAARGEAGATTFRKKDGTPIGTTEQEQTQELQTEEARKLGPPQSQLSSKEEDTFNKKPIQKSVHPAPYTGEPQEVVETGNWLGAIGQSLRNIGDLGIIGTRGFKEYTQHVFYEPFQDVKKPKAYEKVGGDISPPWRGTEFGYGGTKEEKDLAAPPGYKDTSNMTYFDILDQQKKATFTATGVPYKGEPARLLPLRLSETISKETRPKYEKKLAEETIELKNIYQKKIDAGELSFSQAEIEYDVASKNLTTTSNIEYQKNIDQLYSQRMGLVMPERISQLQETQKKIGEPGAYPIIRNIGKGVETAAIIGSSVYGGSGLTYATSAYMGGKTFEQSIDYKGSYVRLTTGQKIAGGASLVLSAAATIYTGNLATRKMYGEWRQAIYSDLSRAPAKVKGVEVLRTDSLSKFNLQSTRSAGTSTSTTYQNVLVKKAGVDQIVSFGKGKTFTRIFNPETMKYVTTIETFTSSASIPVVTTGSFKVGSSRQGEVTYQNVYSGGGQGVYASSKGLKEFNFIAGAKDKGGVYRVVGGTDPYRLTNTVYTTEGGNIRIISDATRGRYDSSGVIKKYQAPSNLNYVSTGGKGGSTELSTELLNLRGGLATQTTTTSQKTGLTELGKTSVKEISGVSGVIETQSSVQLTSPKQETQLTTLAPTQLTGTKQRTQLSYKNPTLQQMGLSQAAVNLPISKQTSATSLMQLNIQSQLSSQKLDQAQTLKYTGGLAPGYSSPSPAPYSYMPKIRIPLIYYNLNGGGPGLPSNIVRGGKRRVSYSPSFSALVLNIGGSRPKESLRTGIGFRPITPGFKFKTGLSFKGIKGGF